MGFRFRDWDWGLIKGLGIGVWKSLLGIWIGDWVYLVNPPLMVKFNFGFSIDVSSKQKREKSSLTTTPLLLTREKNWKKESKIKDFFEIHDVWS